MTTSIAVTTDIKTLIEEVRALKQLIFEEIIPRLKERETDLRNRWLKTRDVVQLLELSARTLQNFRRKGTLPFSKIGGVIFYELEDIDRILRERKQVRMERERKHTKIERERKRKSRIQKNNVNRSLQYA